MSGLCCIASQDSAQETCAIFVAMSLFPEQSRPNFLRWGTCRVCVGGCVLEPLEGTRMTLLALKQEVMCLPDFLGVCPNFARILP